MQKMMEAIEQNFEVGDEPRLTLSNIRGSVDVQAGEDRMIHVEAVIHTRDGDSEHTTVSMEQPSDNHVKVETRYDPLSAIFMRKPCRVEYHVRVPQDCCLEVSGVSSALTVAGTHNGCSLSTVSGEIEANCVSGTLKLSTVSGIIKAGELQGELELHSVSGRARIAISQLDWVQAETVSGDLELETGLTDGPYRFQSLSGNVKLRVPAGTGYDLSFNTLSGKAHHQAPESGGAQVQFDSVSGNLYIVEGDESGEDSSRSAALDDDDRMRILESIERGEMTAEEAIKALNG